MSTYTGVSNFQKTVRFFGPPCYIFIEGDAVALLAGQQTCDSQVSGSSPGWAPLPTYTCVPLTPSNIIWYRSRGVISLAGKVTTGLVESNGSLPSGL